MLEPPREPTPDADAVTPDGVVEALLFVGREDARPLSAEELAAGIRGVEPTDVPAIVERLNARYSDDEAAPRIVEHREGYRVDLGVAFDRVAQRLSGRRRATRLSPAALETLAIVAYRQPVRESTIDELRSAPTRRVARRLVEQGLLRVAPAEDEGDSPIYETTERLLRLVGVATLAELPAVDDFCD